MSLSRVRRPYVVFLFWHSVRGVSGHLPVMRVVLVLVVAELSSTPLPRYSGYWVGIPNRVCIPGYCEQCQCAPEGIPFLGDVPSVPPPSKKGLISDITDTVTVTLTMTSGQQGYPVCLSYDHTAEVSRQAVGDSDDIGTMERELEHAQVLRGQLHILKVQVC